MKIMPTEQLQPHMEMKRKGRRTIKVCFLPSGADAAFLKLDRRGKKRFHNVTFQSPTSPRDTHMKIEATKRACPSTGGNMTKVSRCRLCRFDDRNAVNLAEVGVFSLLLVFFQSLTVLTNMFTRFTAIQPRPDTWERKQKLNAEVS